MSGVSADGVLELARETGFDLAGVAPLGPPSGRERFESWLEAGMHADMEWLERDRARIVDPGRTLPGGRSLLVVGLGHGRAAVDLPGGGRVARYAAGRDYHNQMGKMLRRLARRLEDAGLLGRHRAIVDAGPLLERSHAAEAGLGFESTAANLLHPLYGPWFFLGELLLEDELDPTPADPLGACGTCTACIDACPTRAIRAPGVVDANLCLSYHTIENRGRIPQAVRETVEDRVFGCDVCSEVCPWGHYAPEVDDPLHPAIEGASLVDWLCTSREAFPERFNGSPLQRPRRDGLARNAALALAHRRSEEGRRGLLQALASDPAPRVREAAGWALARGHGGENGVDAALERAHAGDPDPSVREDLAASLERWR